MSRDLVTEGDVRLGPGVEVPPGAVVRRLVAAPGARIEVGPGCVLETGTAVFSRGVVRLGARVRCAPHVLIGDPEGAAAGDVVIDEDVTLGPRAVVEPGAHLGRGCVVAAGAVVSGRVPPRSLVAGLPATVRPLPLTPDEAVQLCARLDAAALAHESLCLVGVEAPGRTALRVNGRPVSYGELLARARGVACALEAGGVRPGQRVLVSAAEKEAFVAGFYGALLAGAAVVPLPDGVAPATLEDVARATGAATCLAGPAGRRALGPALEAFSVVPLEAVPPSDAPAPAEVAPPPPDALGLVLFTSGTTARKKAVALSHAAMVQATRHINAFTGLDSDATEYVAVPLSHSMGLGRVRCLFARAATVVASDGLVTAEAMGAAMREARCDALGAVPAVLAMFSGRARPLLEALGEGLRFVELGSAPLSAEAKLELTRLFPRARLCMHYGLTEASRSTFLEFHSERAHLGTVGRAAPGCEVLVVDAAGQPLPPGQEGEVVVRGAHLASGYLGDEERTRAAFRPHGFHTGDYGVLDAQGYLTLLGRRDELINTGGVKVSPLELEARVRQRWPDLECCVVGLPDPLGLVGEVPALVLEGDARLTLEEVNRALAPLVDRARLPRLLRTVPSLPRTESGKLQRGVLRQQLAAAPAQAR